MGHAMIREDRGAGEEDRGGGLASEITDRTTALRSRAARRPGVSRAARRPRDHKAARRLRDRGQCGGFGCSGERAWSWGLAQREDPAPRRSGYRAYRVSRGTYTARTAS